MREKNNRKQNLLLLVSFLYGSFWERKKNACFTSLLGKSIFYKQPCRSKVTMLTVEKVRGNLYCRCVNMSLGMSRMNLDAANFLRRVAPCYYFVVNCALLAIFIADMFSYFLSNTYFLLLFTNNFIQVSRLFQTKSRNYSFLY